MKVESTRRDILDIFTIIIGAVLLLFALQLYTDSTPCLQYQVVWEECRGTTLVSVAILLICLLLNILNWGRIAKQMTEEEEKI